jgi:hypothetical protein
VDSDGYTVWLADFKIEELSHSSEGIALPPL